MDKANSFEKIADDIRAARMRYREIAQEHKNIVDELQREIKTQRADIRRLENLVEFYAMGDDY